MIVDRYEPVNLSELIPQLRLEMEPELAALDRLLDEDDIFLRIKADFSKRRPNSSRLGRRSTPVEVILRMLVVRRLYDWSFEATERNVSDSLVLRQFCRLYLEPAPDDTTLIRWAKLIGPQTLARLNERAVALAFEHKVTRGRKLRTDGTVVETNISHPTDSTLLNDGVRVLGRLMGKAKEVLEGTGESFRNRTRSAKRLARRIEEGARRRGEEAKEALKGAYERLVEVARASLRQARKVREMLPQTRGGLADELERFEGLVERVVDQTKRRVLKGESVKAAEKLVSLFEPHTSIIRRGKAGKETEYGHKVWLEETEGGIISGYRVLEGNPADQDQLLPALEHHEQRFGKPPRLVAADRGVYSPENERECQERGINRVCLPKPGKKSEQRQEHERQGWFRRGMRYRAGVEGRISVMKRRGYLGKCRDKGESGFGRWVGWGVLSANLSTIARVLATR
ncbi:MAG: ISNCY family transposase [Rubrobacteraceae bacterium]|nr:ISNCY family transposase [Rubrobacteraceae bacterium]